MPDGLTQCSFEFDPKSWEREHGKKCFVSPESDEEMLTENADGDPVWRCPHKAADGESQCLFHLPRDSDAKPDAETVADRLLDIANGEYEALDGEGLRPAQFLGATVEALDFDTAQIGNGRPIDVRHAEIGSANWKVETVSAEVLDARGVNARTGWSCGGVTFSGDARFDGAKFGGDAKFYNTEFGGVAKFDGAEFGGVALFNAAKFGFYTGFREATFGSDAELIDATFISDAVFDGAWFGRDAEFSGANFGRRAGFREAEFGSDAWFKDATFVDGAVFDRADFDRDVKFDAAMFVSGVGFNEATFVSDVRFNEAMFGPNSSFREAEFGGAVWFNEASFGGDVGFREAEFNQGATFTVNGWYPISQFQGDATFSDITADGPLRFVDEYGGQPGQPYTFLGEVEFADADLPDAEFVNVSFRDAPTFTDASLPDAEFVNVSFRDAPTFADADLTRADLSGVSFEGTIFEGANLTRADLSESEVSDAVFNNAILSQAFLYGTDLTNARLYGARMDGAHISDHTDFGVRDRVGAPDQDSGTLSSLLPFYTPGARSSRLPFYGPWPDVRYDERNPEYDRFVNGQEEEGADNISDHTRAATVYAEIERLAKTNADSELASRCYLWRKDMQRHRYRSEEGRGNNQKGFRWVLSGLANISVRYGESPWRVISIAALIIFGCASLYSRFDLIEYSTTPSQSALLTAIGHTPPDSVVTTIDAIYFSTLTFSTLGMGTFQPSGAVGRMVAIAEAISGVVLLALLVFAFGRRATR